MRVHYHTHTHTHTHTCIHAEGIEDIGPAINECVNLRELDLSRNRITGCRVILGFLGLLALIRIIDLLVIRTIRLSGILGLFRVVGVIECVTLWEKDLSWNQVTGGREREGERERKRETPFR